MFTFIDIQTNFLKMLLLQKSIFESCTTIFVFSVKLNKII
jgi:hypothetical protein